MYHHMLMYSLLSLLDQCCPAVAVVDNRQTTAFLGAGVGAGYRQSTVLLIQGVTCFSTTHRKMEVLVGKP
jgi:hypothetical protein